MQMPNALESTNTANTKIRRSWYRDQWQRHQLVKKKRL